MESMQRSNSRARQVKLATVSLLATGALAVLGCDTTAYLARDIQDIASIQSTGLLGATCDETLLERNFRIRFSATTTDAQPIEAGSELVGFRVELGENFSPTDLAVVSNAALLFPTPDVPCVSNADCDAAGLNQFINDGSRFECVQIDGQDTGSDVPLVCGKQISLTVDAGEQLAYLPELPADDNDNRSTVYLMSNSYQMQSFNPFSAGHEFIQGLSPDEGNRRRAALAVAFSETTNKNGRFENSVDAEVGVFAGGATYSATSRTGNSGFDLFRLRSVDEKPSFSTTLNEVDRFIFDQVSSRGDSNHFAALRDAIARLKDEPESRERSIVLLTDGDIAAALRDEAAAVGETFAVIRDEALEANVAMHIVHLDNATLGRVGIGGLDNLAQLACLTGGSFRYVQSGTDLLDAFRAIGEGLPASFEAALRADGIGLIPSGVYTIGFQFAVTLNTKTVNLPFNGNTVRGNERVDTRAAVRLSRPCTTDDDCLLSRVCDVATQVCQAGSDYPACPNGGTLSAAGCSAGSGQPDEGSAPGPDEGSAPGPDEGSAPGPDEGSGA